MPTSDPPLPEPARALGAALRELYLRAGEPSMRTIASACGPGVISHNTVHKVLGAPHAAALRHLLVVVGHLKGDLETFRELWISARLVEETATTAPRPRTTVLANPETADDSEEQRLALADELFLIGHHPRDGRATVNLRSLGIALAGAVFSDLIDAGRVRVDGRHVVSGDGLPAADAVGAFFVERVQGLNDHHRLDLQQLVRFLSGDAVRLVGQRLADAGLVVPERVRRFSRRSGEVRYPQTGLPQARMPMIRLRGHILAGGTEADPQTDPQSAMLAALVEVVGAHKGIPLDFGESQLRERLRLISARLTAQMREVVKAVDLAIAKSAITPDI